MPDSAFIKGRQSPNVEDRRNEYDMITHFIMSSGGPYPDSADPQASLRAAQGLEPGQWLDEGEEPAPFSPLGVDAGLPEVIQQAYLLKRLQQEALMRANPLRPKDAPLPPYSPLEPR